MSELVYIELVSVVVFSLELPGGREGGREGRREGGREGGRKGEGKIHSRSSINITTATSCWLM